MYYEIAPSMPTPWWETRGDESMYDPQCEADRRDEQEAKAEANAAKNDVMEMIQEMDTKVFMDWYDKNIGELSELSVRRFASATLCH